MSSKRSSRSGAKKINSDLLARARQQAQSIEDESAEADADEPEVVSAARPVSRRSAESAVRPEDSAAASRRRSTAARLREQNKESRKKGLTIDEVYDLLHHPTKVVSEADLHARYGFVLTDLRNMGILALVTFAGLIVLAFVLPH